MKHQRLFLYSSGFKWRGENYLWVLVIFHRVFQIIKPRWLWEYQAERDGRYHTRGW